MNVSGKEVSYSKATVCAMESAAMHYSYTAYIEPLKTRNGLNVLYNSVPSVQTEKCKLYVNLTGTHNAKLRA